MALSTVNVEGKAIMEQDEVTFDIALYVALSEEFSIILKDLGSGFKSFELRNLALTCYKGSIQSDRLNRTFQILVVPAGKMGNTRAANVTSAILHEFHPKDVVVMGIAGSLDDDLQPGDVFIPDSINEYLANSAAVGIDQWEFQTSGNHFTTNPRLLNRFQLLSSREDLSKNWRRKAQSRFNKVISKSALASLKAKGLDMRPLVDISAGDDRILASGPAVGKGEAFVNWLKKEVDRKAAAIEMESAGVYDAALIRTPAPRIIAIRGISDFADQRKKVLESVTKGVLRELAVENAITLFIAAVQGGLFAADEAFKSEDDKESIRSPSGSNVTNSPTMPDDPFIISQLGEWQNVYMIPSDQPTVSRFIQDYKLLECCNRIDLILYSSETIASEFRSVLRKINEPIHFRLLIRNPSKDIRKNANIIHSICLFVEIMKYNPNVMFSVRFYDEPPMLRAYFFNKRDGSSMEGLFGIYKYEPRDDGPRFIGAEDNYLFHAKDRSELEKHILNVFQSRFDYLWGKPSAVIFDFDGVIVDSMPFYHQAWMEAFKEFGLEGDIRGKGKDFLEEIYKEVYAREGEKPDITAKEVYRKYAKNGPDEFFENKILQKEREIYKKIFKLKIFPGVRDLLNQMKAKGIKLALVTGSSRSVIDEFKTQDEIFKLFDCIITNEDTKKGKPDPDPYFAAIKYLGIPSENCYVIENAPLGIKSATKAELTCFAIKGNSPLSEEDLKTAGAIRIYKDIKDLGKHIIWADTINLDDFIKKFENQLSNC